MCRNVYLDLVCVYACIISLGHLRFVKVWGAVSVYRLQNILTFKILFLRVRLRVVFSLLFRCVRLWGKLFFYSVCAVQYSFLLYIRCIGSILFAVSGLYENKLYNYTYARLYESVNV